MISCKLYGRTGNQMFQIAAVIGHALKYNYEWRIPSETADRNIWPKHNFNLPELDGTEIFDGFYQEYTHRFNTLPKKDNIILDGYFQSYKYFIDYLPYLRKIFGVQMVTRWNTIAIHVRRGDYLQFPDKHPCLPMEYYINALCLLTSGEGIPNDVQVTIYTDDFEWCRDNFTTDKIGYNCYVKPISNEPPENDIYEMASSEHIIIANSSFSYWAAMLNANPYKAVISPHYTQWFGEGNRHLDTNDLLPVNWIQVKY